MFGNKTKMSRDQTKFVEAVQAKGWQVERGLQRVNNPDYQNFKTEAELKGLQVNRFTDEKIFQAEKVINQARLEQEKSLKFFKESQNKLADLESKHQQFDKKVSETKDLIDHISDEINPQSKIERKLNLAVNFSSNHLYNPFEISIEVFFKSLKSVKKKCEDWKNELTQREKKIRRKRART